MPSPEKPFVAWIVDGARRRERRKQGVDQLSDDQLAAAYDDAFERLREVGVRAISEGVGILAAWGGSRDNFLQRPLNELRVLYGTYIRALVKLQQDLRTEEYRTVRVAHVGHRELLKERTPETLELIDEVMQQTKNRNGMVLALCIDHDGNMEVEDAVAAWQRAGCPGGSKGFRQFLDLPRQGIPFQPLDLIIRTGDDQDVTHDNEFLLGYRNNTRLRLRDDVFSPDYTDYMFSEDIEKFRRIPQRKGQ